MVIQFKIQLANVSSPVVWRQLLVPAQFTFRQFHAVIQAAFGWENEHLYLFSPGGYQTHPVIEEPDGFFPPDKEASKTLLSEIFTQTGQTFVYIYDMGDDWIHNITVEQILPDIALNTTCLAGKGACPPEGCGGPHGYKALKATLKDPKNPDLEELKEWLGVDEGEEWDTNAFPLEKVQKKLRKIGIK